MRPIEIRFWEKVNKNAGVPAHVGNIGNCWEWTGAKATGGYGVIRSKGKNIYCHRLSLSFSGFEIPAGMYALHKCDNPACVNPSHLFLGTHQDNSDDKMKKGRCAPPLGENHGMSKLKNEQAVEVKKMISLGVMGKEIAKIFNISRASISNIKNGKKWAHV